MENNKAEWNGRENILLHRQVKGFFYHCTLVFTIVWVVSDGNGEMVMYWLMTVEIKSPKLRNKILFLSFIVIITIVTMLPKLRHQSLCRFVNFYLSVNMEYCINVKQNTFLLSHTLRMYVCFCKCVCFLLSKNPFHSTSTVLLFNCQ